MQIAGPVNYSLITGRLKRAFAIRERNKAECPADRRRTLYSDKMCACKFKLWTSFGESCSQRTARSYQNSFLCRDVRRNQTSIRVLEIFVHATYGCPEASCLRFRGLCAISQRREVMGGLNKAREMYTSCEGKRNVFSLKPTSTTIAVYKRRRACIRLTDIGARNYASLRASRQCDLMLNASQEERYHHVSDAAEQRWVTIAFHGQMDLGILPFVGQTSRSSLEFQRSDVTEDVRSNISLPVPPSAIPATKIAAKLSQILQLSLREPS